jgi:hypothetical protein
MDRALQDYCGEKADVQDAQLSLFSLGGMH